MRTTNPLEDIMRISNRAASASLLLVVSLVLACFAAVSGAPAARAASTPDGVYMLSKALSNGNGSTFNVRLSSMSVAGGQTAAEVIYQNVTSSPQGLTCPQAVQRTSITLNGRTYTESDSYCAKFPGTNWTVPGGSKFPSWAKYDVVPELAQPITLNDWWGFGGANNLQLIPFGCIVGPGGRCLGVPHDVPVKDFPTPPEWLTSPVTGGCVLSIATGGWPTSLAKVWITGLGGAVMMQASPDPVYKAYIILRQATPYRDCVVLATIAGIALKKATQQELQQALKYPPVTRPI